MILLIDNYDSFAYNLYQMLGEIEPDIRVIRNDAMTVEEIRQMNPDRIILSPAPDAPRTPASSSRRRRRWDARFRPWASALDTRPSAWPTARALPTQSS